MFRIALAFLLAITALAPAANAQSFSAANVPDGAAQKLAEIANAGQTPKSIAFTTNGGWAILHGSNGFAFAGIPDAAAQKLSELSRAGWSLDSIAFTSGGGWAIIYGGGGYWWDGIPTSAGWKLSEVLNAGIKSISFTPNGGWVILHGSNGFAESGIPTAAAQTLAELATAGHSHKSIAFTPEGGWAILYGSNGNSWSGIPGGAAQKLQEINTAGQNLRSIAFAPGGGWAILHDGGSTTAGGPSAQQLKALEDEVFRLVNQRRAEAGLAPYTRSPQLDTAAHRHSLDMATKENFSHTGTDGTAFWDRIGQAGYSGAASAENIAAGSDTAAGVMSSWMESTGHRGNILSATANEIGISVVHQAGSRWKFYWTQVFGKR